MKKTTTIEIGRSAITGKFIPVSQAERQPNTTVVQHIKVPVAKPAPAKGK